jgi:hypothetical protein
MRAKMYAKASALRCYEATVSPWFLGVVLAPSARWVHLGAIQPALPVEEHVVPPDGADMREQRRIEVLLVRIPGA